MNLTKILVNNVREVFSSSIIRPNIRKQGVDVGMYLHSIMVRVHQYKNTQGVSRAGVKIEEI